MEAEAEARHTCDHTSGGAESREGQEAVSGQGCGEEVRVQNSRRKLDSFRMERKRDERETDGIRAPVSVSKVQLSSRSRAGKGLM